MTKACHMIAKYLNLKYKHKNLFNIKKMAFKQYNFYFINIVSTNLKFVMHE